MGQQFDVVFCERPVIRGQALDRFVLGKPLSHTFLALKDESGRVVSEIHGTWSSPQTDHQPRVSKFLELTLSFAKVAGGARQVSNVFKAWASGAMPVNRMVVLSVDGQCNGQYQRAVRRDVVFSGSSQDVARVWENMIDQSRFLDSLRLPYIRYGGEKAFNCQQMLRALIKGTGAFPDEGLVLELGDSGWSRFSCQDFY